MDIPYLYPSASAQPLVGEVESVFGSEPSADDPGLWLAGNDGDEGLLGSFESGGVLMNSGRWSISTAPGEEGLRWNAVKTEVFDEWAGLTGGGGANKSNPLQPSVLPGTTKSKAESAGFPGVKAGPDEGWAELISPPMALAFPPSAADGSAAASAATTPNSPPSSIPCGAVSSLAPALEGQSLLFFSRDCLAMLSSPVQRPGDNIASPSRSMVESRCPRRFSDTSRACVAFFSSSDRPIKTNMIAGRYEAPQQPAPIPGVQNTNCCESFLPTLV